MLGSKKLELLLEQQIRLVEFLTKMEASNSTVQKAKPPTDDNQ